MNIIELVVKQLPSGGFKVVVWGYTDSHMGDWRGCNFRIASVDDQPHRGFKSIQAAEDWGRARFKTKHNLRSYGQGIGDGSFLSDDVFKSFVKDLRLTN